MLSVENRVFSRRLHGKKVRRNACSSFLSAYSKSAPVLLVSWTELACYLLGTSNKSHFCIKCTSVTTKLAGNKPVNLRKPFRLMSPLTSWVFGSCSRFPFFVSLIGRKSGIRLNRLVSNPPDCHSRLQTLLSARSDMRSH